MSNRRLIGALSILLLACLFMSIGCGDGKRNTRSNPRKSFPGGKVGGDPKSLQEKSKKLQDIDARARGRIDGQTIDKSALQQGTYTLEEVMGFVKFMRNQNELYAFAAHAVSGGNLGQPIDGGDEGMLSPDVDESRSVEIPRSFTVGAGGIQIPAADQNLSYSCQVGMNNKLSHSLNAPAPGGATTEINLLNRLMSGSSQASLSGNKKLIITIRQTPNGARFVVEVEEMKKANKGRRDATLMKIMVFSYKLQRPAQATQLPEPSSEQQRPPTTGSGATNPPTEQSPPAEPSQNETTE